MRRRPLIAALAAGSLPGVGMGDAVAAAANQRPAAAGPKTLRVVFRTPETTLDPTQTNSDHNTTILLSQIFEAPLCYDYLARPARLVPATAAALPEVSADSKTFTVRLQPGIFFSDDPAFKGQRRELVAQDYVYAIKRFFDPRWKSSDLYIYESSRMPGLVELRERAVKNRQPFDYDTEVEGVRALDRYTLRVRLGEADPRFIWRLADPCYMGAVAREVVEYYGDDIGAHPVGTGAFRLKSWRRASRIELEKSPSWRGAVYSGTPAADPWAQEIATWLQGRTLPMVDNVDVSIVEEEQPRWLSFLNGSFDWLEVPGSFRQQAAPAGRLAPYLAKQGVRLQALLQPDMLMNFFFMEHPLVGGYTPEKVALRRAISLALDNDAYRDRVQGGYGIRAHSTVSPHTSGYDPEYRSEMGEHSPARARALLDLYGYVDRNGDGWREQPDGSPLVLVKSSSQTQSDRRVNELWKRSMDAVGLKVEFEISSWPELLNKSRAGALMIWGYAWSAGSPDGGFFLSIAYGPNASEANDPRFSLPAFDRLFEKQRAMPDGPEREAVIRQAKNLLVAYMPFKVLMHSVLPELLQPWTRGYWRHPFMRDIWRFVGVEGGGQGVRAG
jgi:ABC-type transport system substrate-binding protein